MSIFQKIQSGEIPYPKAAETLGMKILSFSEEKGEMETEFLGSEAFTNPIGDIQGGFLCAMLDDTLGPALVCTLGGNEFAPTLELKTQFIQPAKVGPIQGKGRVAHKGNQVCFLEGELYQNDKLIARATATAMIKRINR